MPKLKKEKFDANLEALRKELKRRFKETNHYSSQELGRILSKAMKVLSYEEEYAAMDPDELKAKTVDFRRRIEKVAGPAKEELAAARQALGSAQDMVAAREKADKAAAKVGEAYAAVLDDILPEAFAACREATWRVDHKRHYPVQVLAGILLHQGRIAEMRTGEGKTHMATLPAYLNGLTGEGVHIVTVNDYLARRDSEWMGKIYNYLGLSVGLIVHGLENEQRRAAYEADITYGTNNEMGFDYLRDNMVQYIEQKVQRGHVFAIVDEVDSILIDEARTPLIISGRGEASTELYDRANRLAAGFSYERVKELNDKQNAEEVAGGKDVLVDEKARSATLTSHGIAKAEKFFKLGSLADAENMQYNHHINQAIRAHGVMKRDVDYMVADGQVLIIDEFTGRIMYGRRYNEGLHQAIEAKERVKIENESKTLATITFQNYFRLYKKLSGMTGTALTERAEFMEIYNLDVVESPTNKPMIRKDQPDLVYRTVNAKYKAIIDQIEQCYAKGQPVLVGTVSVEKSEILHLMLKKKNIEHSVLNAKYHDREADVVAQAGKSGAVTISTNMAGRGTDIKLGGNEEYLAKAEMRRNYEQVIKAAMEAAETSDEQALDALQTFVDLEKKYVRLLRACLGAFIDELRAFFRKQDKRAIEMAVSSAETQDKRVLAVRRALADLKEKCFEDVDASIEKGLPGTVLVNTKFLIKAERRHSDKRVAEAVEDIVRDFEHCNAASIRQRREELIDEAAEYLAKAEMRLRNEALIAEATSFSETEDAATLATRATYAQLEAKYKQGTEEDADRVRKAGGLFILGTERHESRRIDNQLRGRSGRQGDPGESRFFLSMEDDLMRLFGGERLANVMTTLRQPEEMSIESGMVSKQIEGAQKKIEGQNFAIRKNVLKYDDVMNRQRELIYGQRNKVLEGEELRPILLKMIEDSVNESVDKLCPADGDPQGWQYGALRKLYEGFLTKPDDFTDAVLDPAGRSKEIDAWANLAKTLKDENTRDETLSEEERQEAEALYVFTCAQPGPAETKAVLIARSRAVYERRERELEAWAKEMEARAREEEDGEDTETPAQEEIEASEQEAQAPAREKPMRLFERMVLLRNVDSHWMDHIDAMDELKRGIGLRAYAQQDPVVAYRMESFDMFEEMTANIREATVKALFTTRVRSPEDIKRKQMAKVDGDKSEGEGPQKEKAQGKGKGQPVRKQGKKVGPNDLCPCGSGRKYKNCCGDVRKN